nr:TraB domain-containing protein [Tanacetum cinerariifolium]
MATNPNDVRLTVLMALQEAHDKEYCLEEQMLNLMHRFTYRFTRRRPEIDRLKSLPDHPLTDYGRYALERMTGGLGETRVFRRGSRVEARRIRNLKGDATEEFRSRIIEGASTQIEVISASDANTMWNTLATIIKDATKDSLGVVIGSSKIHTVRRESWWLFEKVQSKVTEKQARFRELLSLAQAKEKAYEDLYKKIDYKEGANDIFRIVKARERRRRDLGDLCVIKDEGGQTITDDKEIKKRWGDAFHPSTS